MIIQPIHIQLKNQKTITLRSPEEHEAEKVLNAFAKLAESSPYILTTPESARKMTIEDEKKWIISNNSHETSFVILAECAEEIIGISGFHGFKDAKRKHRGIFGITIAPEFRGYGLGESKMKHMIQVAKSLPGIQSLELSVMSKNKPAIQLYEKLGFQKIGITPKAFILSDGSFSDDILMQILVE